MPSWRNVPILARYRVHDPTGTLQVLCEGRLQIWQKMRPPTYHTGWACREPPDAISTATALHAGSTTTSTTFSIWSTTARIAVNAGARSRTTAEWRRHDAAGFRALPVCTAKWLRHSPDRYDLHLGITQIWFTSATRPHRDFTTSERTICA